MEVGSDHGWKAAPGCRILVIDGGAVRFDFPREWIVHSGANQVLLIDRHPPNDRSYIGLRWRRLSAAETAVPLPFLVENSTLAEQRRVIHRGEIVRIFRLPLEVAWVQLRV